MPDTSRLVEVRGLREGSGYLITDRVVLTAWHLIRPPAGEEIPPVRVRVEGRLQPGQAPLSVEEPAEVLWPKEEPGEDLDFALLLLAAPLPCEPQQWGELGDSGRLTVQAIGYPDASIDHSLGVRDTKEVNGWTRLGDKVRERRQGRGTFEIHLPDEDQPQGSPAAAWPAMSGAAVFAGEMLIGVVRLASAQNARAVLDALPVERLLSRGDVQEAVRRSGAMLPQRQAGSAQQAQRLTYRWPLAWDFEAYMEERRGDSFAGREWLFEQIGEWCASGKSRALLIRADFGVGKSALLAEHVRRHRGGTVLAWHFCQHDTQATLRPGTFVRSLATQLSEALPDYREAVEGSLELQKALDEADVDPGSALEAAVLAPLAKIRKPPEPRLLVIDALDEALELDPGAAGRRLTIVDLLAKKAGRFPRWLRLLTSSRPNPAVLTPLGAAFVPQEIDAQSAGNREDLRRFILGQLAQPGLLACLTCAHMEAESFAQLLLSHSGGKFLFVVHALRDLAAGNLTPLQLAALPPGMDAFYLDFFARRFGAQAERYGDAAALLAVMCAAQEPLSRAELAAVLEVSPRSVQLTHARLPDVLCLSAERLHFSHHSVKEWLIQDDAQGMPRAVVFALDLDEARGKLTRWARACVAAGSAHSSLYLLRNLAAHLPEAQERCALYATVLLESFEWSCARLETSGVPGLLADAAHLDGHPAQHLFQDLVHNSELALRRSTAQWAAQVLGRLGTHTGPTELQPLAAAAGRWLTGNPEQEKILVPATRSLRWVHGQDRVLEGQAPLLVLADGRIACAGGQHTLRVWDPARRAEPVIFEGHTKALTALALLPDGRIVSAGHDRRVRVWDPQLLTEPLTFKGHSEAVMALAVLPDGRIVSAGADSTVRVWNPHGAGAPLVLEGHSEGVLVLAVLPDGRIVSGSDDTTLRIWDPARPAEPLVLEGHESRVVALTVLPDGRIASSSWDCTVRVWDSQGREPPRVFKGHAGEAGPLVCLADGRVVSGGDDGSVRIWDPHGREEPQVLEGHADYVVALTVLPDDRIVSGSHDGTARVWHTRRVPQRPHPGHVVFQGHSDKLRAVLQLPDGRIASSADDRTIRLWDPARQSASASAAQAPVAIQPLLALPDGQLAWGGADHTVQVRDLLVEPAPKVLSGHSGEVIALEVLPDGRLVSGARDRTVRVWDPHGRQAPRILHGHKGAVEVLKVLPDGRIVSAAWDRSVRVWDLAHPDEPLVLKGHTDRIRALAVLPDGRIASGGLDGSVRIWDLAGGEPLVLTEHLGRVRALAALADGRIACSCRDRTLRIWDPRAPAEPLLLEGPGAQVSAVAPLPGLQLACAYEDGSIRVWDLREAHQPLVITAHEGEVQALAVLPDGRLVSCGDDCTVRIWTQLLPAAQRSFIADAPVLSLAVVSAGLLAAGCKDGTIHLLRSGQC